MTDETNMPRGCDGRDPPERWSVGELIRAAADEELTDEQISAFESLCAEHDCTKDRVLFERTLRSCCGRVMSKEPCCPEKLRQRILSMSCRTIAAQDGGAPAPIMPEPVSATTRERSFWRRAPGMVAAAAVLALVATVLITQSVRFAGAGGVGGAWTTEAVAYRDRVAGFVTSEHRRCEDDIAAAAKLVYHDPDAASEHFIDAFGVPAVDLGVDATDMPAGSGELVFWGGGDCHVPGASHSGHVRFDAVTPEGEPIRMSLFVMRDPGTMPIEPGMTYQLRSPACSKAGVRLFAWARDGVVYLLVSEADGSFCERIRRALHAPDAVTSA